MELQSASQIVAQTHAVAAATQLPAPPPTDTAPLPRICTGCEELDGVLGRWRRAQPSASPSASSAFASSASAAASLSAATPASERTRRPGLPAGTALEVLGPTAAGKSRLAAQVAVQWAQAACAGPPDECVCVLDTEGSLTPESLVRTANVVCEASPLPAWEAIRRIRYTRVTSATQLVALLQTLGEEQYTRPPPTHPFPAMLERPHRCLVVLDSLDEYLHGQGGTSLRARLRTSYTAFATALAARGVSLVATNGMGIKVTRDRGGLLVPIAAGQTEFGPTAGGDDDLRNWRSLLGKDRVCRILLTWDTPDDYAGDVRWAFVFPRLDTKGASQLWSDAGQRVPFAVGLDGLIRAMGT